MADETKHVDNSTDTVVDDTKAIPTVEELQKQLLEKDNLIAEANKTIETQGTKISSLDSANSKKQNDYNDLLKSTETDKQTKEREQAERLALEETDRQARQKEKAETIAELNKLKIDTVAYKLGYTEEDLKLLNFKTPEDVANHHKWQEARDTRIKEDTAKNIIDAHKGKPEGGYNKQPADSPYSTILNGGLDS
ncbi:MAG: hypothetical protein GY777_15995 [Candidatus Brocadiaceae bacterium]|nr:hypothetical protein [Candidatus Brocadiaceae bacterium]